MAAAYAADRAKRWYHRKRWKEDDKGSVYESEAGIAMATATSRFMQETAKTARRRVLGISGGQGERWDHRQRWQGAARDW
jgi:hypothetical protein